MLRHPNICFVEEERRGEEPVLVVAPGEVEPVCLLHGSVSADITIVFTRLSCSYC